MKHLGALLVVDDQPALARAMGRFFSSDFATVHVAGNAVEAESKLASAKPPITHVICDYFLGDDSPLGTELLPRWRVQFPTIQVAVLLSGSEIDENTHLSGVDAVLSKPPDLRRMRLLLTVHAKSPHEPDSS